MLAQLGPWLSGTGVETAAERTRPTRESPSVDTVDRPVAIGPQDERALPAVARAGPRGADARTGCGDRPRRSRPAERRPPRTPRRCSNGFRGAGTLDARRFRRRKLASAGALDVTGQQEADVAELEGEHDGVVVADLARRPGRRSQDPHPHAVPVRGDAPRHRLGGRLPAAGAAPRRGARSAGLPGRARAPPTPRRPRTPARGTARRPRGRVGVGHDDAVDSPHPELQRYGPTTLSPRSKRPSAAPPASTTRTRPRGERTTIASPWPTSRTVRCSRPSDSRRARPAKDERDRRPRRAETGGAAPRGEEREARSAVRHQASARRRGHPRIQDRRDEPELARAQAGRARRARRGRPAERGETGAKPGAREHQETRQQHRAEESGTASRFRTRPRGPCGGSAGASRGRSAAWAATDAASTSSSRGAGAASRRTSGGRAGAMPSVAPNESWKPTSVTFDGPMDEQDERGQAQEVREVGVELERPADRGARPPSGRPARRARRRRRRTRKRRLPPPRTAWASATPRAGAQPRRSVAATSATWAPESASTW